MSIAEAPAGSGQPASAIDPYRQAQRRLLAEVLTPTLDALYPAGRYLLGLGIGINWNPTATDPAARYVHPDVCFIPHVPGPESGEPRRTFEFWEEACRQLIVVECVTGDGYAERDPRPRIGKFWVCERPLRVVSYLIWQPAAQRLDVYEDRHGRLTAQAPTDDRRYWTPEMGCSFGVWCGTHDGIAAHWLRAWDGNGNLLPSAAERNANPQGNAGPRLTGAANSGSIPTASNAQVQP